MNQLQILYFNGSATSTESYVDVCNDKTNGIMRQVQEAKRAYGGIENAIDKYVGSVDEQAYAKAAAFVLGFFGILIALSSGTNITGFATGGSEKSMIFISGGLMIIASMVSLSRSFKK